MRRKHNVTCVLNLDSIIIVWDSTCFAMHGSSISRMALVDIANRVTTAPVAVGQAGAEQKADVHDAAHSVAAIVVFRGG